MQTSPHVDKAAREQWEYQLHSRFLSVNAETEDLAHDVRCHLGFPTLSYTHHAQFFNLIERGLPPGIAMRAHITTFFDSTELYDAPEETVQFNMDNLKEEIAGEYSLLQVFFKLIYRFIYPSARSRELAPIKIT